MPPIVAVPGVFVGIALLAASWDSEKYLSSLVFAGWYLAIVACVLFLAAADAISEAWSEGEPEQRLEDLVKGIMEQEKPSG